MKSKNIRALENLSLFCHLAGLGIIFSGVLIGLLSFWGGDYKHVQIGIFIFITGYAFVKISVKISTILKDEGNVPPGYTAQQDVSQES